MDISQQVGQEPIHRETLGIRITNIDHSHDAEFETDLGSRALTFEREDGSDSRTFDVKIDPRTAQIIYLDNAVTTGEVIHVDPSILETEDPEMVKRYIFNAVTHLIGFEDPTVETHSPSPIGVTEAGKLDREEEKF